MNKNAIKKFAIEARKKLIDSVSDKAGMLGITEKSCSEPIAKGVDFEVYQTVAGTEVTLNKRQCEQRRRLVSQIHSRGFEAVVEEVAYTWFNRICAIRFMEVNDYLPNRVRVLSSEKEGKMEPDLVTMAPDVDLDLTAQEKEEIINWKLSGTSEDTDKLYCKLFLKQCHQLHDILPGLFEADSDYMELLFGISYTNKDDVIYMLVSPDTGISENDFNVSAVDEEGNPTGQVEIIGWLYQYYNTELKDDTFAKLKKNIKITKERIPAATQLFTPDWIVRYMVENSVGRIWIEHLRAVNPSTDEKATAERFGWKYYLPEAEQEDAVNVKLAEIRNNYKDLKPTDITCIDPCMGSGHILIAMFDVLMDIYESAGYDKREAAFEIVEHNIHGLDIDKRAYQLAYFSVMMKGRGYNRRFLRGRDGKPEPKVYTIVESNEINKEHLRFFGNSLAINERMQAVEQMKILLDTFVDAREYGSIINVDEYNWGVLRKFVNDLDNNGQISFDSVGSEETQEQMRKLVRVAKNLGQKYDAVVTNPPYMGAAGMGKKLSDFVKTSYPDSKSDMSTVCMESTIAMCKAMGYMAMINIPVWMFISSYEKMRVKLFNYNRCVNMLHLGRGIFGSDFGTTAFVFSREKCREFIAPYQRLFIRQGEVTTIEEKKKFFFSRKNMYYSTQDKFSLLPGFPVAYWSSENLFDAYRSGKMADKYSAAVGIQTGNNDLFLKYWYEVSLTDINFLKADDDIYTLKWYPHPKGGAFRKWYGNYEYVVNWKDDGSAIHAYNKSNTKIDKYKKNGVCWSHTTSGAFSARLFNKTSIPNLENPVLFCDGDERLLILAYFNTKLVNYLLNLLNSTLHYHVGDILRLPLLRVLDPEKILGLSKNCIKLATDDWNDYETSWDFRRHPLLPELSFSRECDFMNEDGKQGSITVTGIKLSDEFERWEKECTVHFNQLKANEEELNCIFIDIFGLQNELTSEVEDKDITVRKADLSRDIRSFISYAVGCIFGRYSLDKEGLIYAGGEWDNSKYQSIIPDVDNCIPITDEEYFSDDIVGRFVEFVKTVYGAETLEENLDFISKALGNKGDTARDVIRNYFLKDFYADHLKVYQKRPIYWLFDSGKENGFKALIYMHRYDADTVGRVRTDYLHRAQKYVETAMQSAKYTIDNATSASEKSKATKAVTKYTKQLAEMKIYDEAIAHIANKRIEIDLDDGVKVNYAKFQGIEVAQEGKKSIKVNLLAKI